MDKLKVGILHPGNMGISVAAAAQNSGCEVYWVSEGRSPQTRERAAQHHLVDAGSMADLCHTCSILISICPPRAAEEVAEQGLRQNFEGLYLDANAISPQRALRIGERMSAAGVDFVDGGIIGGPAWEAGSTWLYLSGDEAGRVTDCFKRGPLETMIIGDEIGKASALKMCYAAWTKGGTALLCAILATADVLGVREILAQQWERDWPGFPEQTENRARRVTAKAWRFAGEMEEISATFDQSGLPGGFHAAAAELYHRMADFKDAEATPSLKTVLSALTQNAE